MAKDINPNDQFINPIGATLRNNIPIVYDHLLNNENPEDLTFALDDIVRIGAVSKMPPSQILSFIFKLKDIIRNTLDVENKELVKEFNNFENKIDNLALCAFDLYTNYQRKIHTISLNQIKSEKESLLLLLRREGFKEVEVKQ
jgi:hypothetical protein